MRPSETCASYLGSQLDAVIDKLSSPQIKAVLKQGSIKVKLPGGFVSQKKRRKLWSSKIVDAITGGNDDAASELLQQWLLNHERQLLIDYLDALGVRHRAGETDETFLLSHPHDKLRDAARPLFDSHDRDTVAAYLTYIAYQQKANVFDDWELLVPQTTSPSDTASGD